jgi:UDP-3-O-[3-hydroxymyristoyl] glucosamine N-acyltransferase
MKLNEIARALSATVTGDGEMEVTRLVHPADAEGPHDLAVALSDEARKHLGSVHAGAVLLPAKAPAPANGLASIAYGGNERVAVAILTAMFDARPAYVPGVHPSAVVAPDAVLGEGVSIGPLCVVGPGAEIGAGTVLVSQVTVGANASIGRDGLLHPGVRIGDRVRLGDRVIVHFNTAIGCDGFSFIPVSNPDGTSNGLDRPKRTHSLGRVVVGDDVEIGASTTIDRATLRDTRIGSGTKIDNQVQIGHNVVIGENCLICGMSGIAGSTVLGDRVVIASGVGISAHLTIGEGATVGAGTGLAGNVPPGEVYIGFPGAPYKLTMERLAHVGRLKQLYPRVEDLKNRLEALEKAAKAG